LTATSGLRRTIVTGWMIGAISISNISSRIQKSQVMDATFVKECQSLKSRGKWIISQKTHLRFR
jgi:hypothetical protein